MGPVPAGDGEEQATMQWCHPSVAAVLGMPCTALPYVQAQGRAQGHAGAPLLLTTDPGTEL